MIRTVKRLALVLSSALMLPVAMMAQKIEKDKDKKEKQQIIITTNNDEKMTIVVDGDKVTVDGKDVKDLKNKDITVRRVRNRDMTGAPHVLTLNGDEHIFEMDDQNFGFFGEDANKAMLGVVTERVDEGAKISQVNKESAAEKAGLKEGDIITKVDDKTIADPDDLTKAIQARKPGEKVSISYLRDKKEQKVNTELGKWKGVRMKAFNFSPEMAPDFKVFENVNPRIQGIPRTRIEGQIWTGNRPRLGISVQDTEDGKGVKVLEVDEDSNAAKAGIKEDDIITHIDDKAVNSADEVSKIVRENKDKTSMMLKLTRDGKVRNVEVKVPRKLKTADL